MLQFCIFGGHHGLLSAEKKGYFTVFGSCELRRPTLARQLITARRIRGGHEMAPRSVFVTIFGSTEIKCPTLAEEFVDWLDAARSGALDLDLGDADWAELEKGSLNAIASLTLFGSFDQSSLPDENDEIESLALQHHFGAIHDDSRRILEMGVGQSGAQRRTIIQQAVQAA